jgi:UDP-glucose 4-epimerase
MNILITGGNGFLGSNLTKKFIDNGHNVTILDLKKNKFSIQNKKAKFIKCDLTNMRSLNKINLKKSIDIVLHCAGQPSAALSFTDPEKDLRLNILSTLNILRFIETKNIKKFAFASTFNVYEENNLVPKLNENSYCKPKSLYAISKISAENYVRCICERNDISWNIFRMFNIYGPGQDPRNKSLGMINIFLNMALNSNSINVKGSLKRFRDFVYIDDVVDAWFRVILKKNTKNKIYNIGTGKKTTINELLKLILNLLNKKIQIKETKGTPGDFNGCYANITKLQKDINFSPKISLREGLSSFIKWSKKF